MSNSQENPSFFSRIFGRNNSQTAAPPANPPATNPPTTTAAMPEVASSSVRGRSAADFPDNNRAAAADEAEPKNAVIPIQIKKSREFAKQSANLSRADAHHDLNEVFKNKDYNEDANLKAAFDEGLPRNVQVLNGRNDTIHETPDDINLDENACLTSVIKQIAPDSVTYKRFNDVKSMANDVCNVTDGLSRPSCLKIGRSSPINPGDLTQDQIYFEYDAVKFVIKCGGTPKEEVQYYKGDNFGRDFWTNTNLGGGSNYKNAYIVVDFNQHGFIERLKQGDHLPDVYINYLMLPEVVNDPAGKTNVFTPTIFGDIPRGLNLYSWVQTNANPMSYTKYNCFDTNPMNNFYSAYDFSLLPIQSIYSSAKNLKFQSTLNITYNDNNSGLPPLVDTIEDSKGENSITTVVGFLNKIINQIKNAAGLTANNRRNLQFNFNSKVQQKRGGDWFQALCCLDIQNRELTRCLPTSQNRTTRNGSDLKANIGIDGPVYFVSHDRIAVAYALLNGINVIYIGVDGSIYVFKNKGDYHFEAGPNIPKEKILFDGMRMNWVNTRDPRAYVESGDFIDSIRAYNQYKEYSKKIIEQNRRFFKSPSEAENILFGSITNPATWSPQDWNGNLRDVKNFMNNVEKYLVNLFTSAVKLAFVMLNFKEIGIDTKKLEENYRDFLLNVNVNFEGIPANDIFDLSNELNIIKGVYDRFGITAREGDWSVYETWVDRNIKSLDVYKAANDFRAQIDSIPGDVDFTRLVNFPTDATINTTTKTDKHIFLPYIQSIGDTRDTSRDNDSSLRKIVDKLSKMVPVLNKFKERLEREPENVRGAPKQKFYLNTANLIYEALRIFLSENMKRSNPDLYTDILQVIKRNIIENDPNGLKSTDNLVVAEDVIEITDLKTDGKVSNSAEFSMPAIEIRREEVVGGGWERLNVERAESVICDVSVKQITWPLLTCILLERPNREVLTNYLNQIITYEAENIEGRMVYTENQKIMIRQIQYLLGVPLLTGGQGNKMDPLGLSYDLNKATSRLERDQAARRVAARNELDRRNRVGSNLGQNREELVTTNEPNLLQNFNAGYHPLLPIYMILSPFYYTLGPKYEGDPFFDTYCKYFDILKKMIDVIDSNYLSQPYDNIKVIAAYLIGFTLKSFLFTSNTSDNQYEKILEVVGIPKEEFLIFSLKNDAFSNLMIGTVFPNESEDNDDILLLDSEIFKNFINNEVGIREMLLNEPPRVRTYQELKNDVYVQLKRISEKINSDRGTPVNVSDARGLQQQTYSTPISQGLTYPTFQPQLTGEEASGLSGFLRQGPLEMGTGFGGKTRKHKKAYKNRSKKNKKPRHRKMKTRKNYKSRKVSKNKTR